MKAILIVAIVAVLGYIVWDSYFARSNRIEAAYAACMKELGPSGEVGKAGTGTGRIDGPAPIVQGMRDALSSLVQGAAGTVCGAMRDKCTNDYDGLVCQTALKRYK